MQEKGEVDIKKGKRKRRVEAKGEGVGKEAREKGVKGEKRGRARRRTRKGWKKFS